MNLYLDASILLPTLIEEPASPAVDEFLLGAESELLVSDFAAAEVAAALSRLVRMRLLKKADAMERVADFDVWRAVASTPVDLHAADARLANAYVRRFELKLRAPDAIHAAVARRLDATLVTLDQRLADAARELGISVEEPVVA
ncbi:MAG TPA: type II toxin-antitoxin system VapC family toxin [Rhizomicrobium sp.]|nr:type II toxin-antitoxin system VapC family toxin [Rhizomicrobium sp.]